MKKKMTLLALAVSLSMGLSANPISRAEARQVAQEFVGISDSSTDDVPVAPYYVFSRGAGKGYVIVSGDDSTAPILGYTEQGDFDYDQLPVQLQAMLDGWGEKIGKVQAAPKRQQVKRSVRERLETARRGVEAFKESWEDVPYLCQTHWNQGAPYNNLCPVNPNNTSQRAVTGCVATAAAQIIYYFHKDNPDTLLYATPTYADNWGSSYGNYPVTESLPKGTLIEYDQMKLSGSGNSRQNTAVARLMFAIGTCSRLNYGPSTAGQPDAAGSAMTSQFMLENTYVGKWNYSQQGWERLIYNSLKAGSPMLYGGTHPDQGGHAVVLDGYQAKTGLYHFNFGWGGSGDGYYTVDDETGMNGFKADQRGCLNFKPKKRNVKATMSVPKLYAQANNTIKVTVANNGTLPFSELSFWANTSRNVLPTSTTQKMTDLTLASGESGEVTFTYKPAQAKTVYLFVTDENKNILDSCSVEIAPSVPDLVLNGVAVDAGTEQVKVDDLSFGIVNSMTATVSASLTNGEGGTYCQPRVACQLSSYDTATKSWSDVLSTVYVRDEIFDEGETKTVSFAFTKLTEGTLYRAALSREVRAGSAFGLRHAENVGDTVAYFTVRQSDFRMTIEGRNATATGHWNEVLFNQSGADATVCSYDLTGIDDLTSVPKAANPNAVFYTAVPVEGNNVVCNGVCENLVVEMGSEFKPASGFVATTATFVLEVGEAGVWGDALVPFQASVPYGMQVKNIVGVSTTTVTTENVRAVDAMSQVLYMADRDGLNTLTGSNVPVTGDTVSTAADGLFVGMTVRNQADVRSMVFGYKNGNPYYLPVTEAVGLSPFKTQLGKYTSNGYRATPISEVRYPELADSINRAYQVMAEYGAQPGQDALNSLLASIKVAEDIFTYLTAESASEVRNAAKVLGEAVEAYLNALTTGIEVISEEVSSSESEGATEYYSPSGIRLQQPERGLVIVKRGNTVRKVMVE